MPEVRNPHDACFQTLIQQPEHARAFFQHYLEPAWQAIVDLDTLVLASASHVTSKLKRLHSDILYQVDLLDPGAPGETAYLYTIVEHQSTPDPAMAVRLLQYKASLLLKHVQEEYLPPIHTMLFYHGDPTPYPYELDLRNSFRTPDYAAHTLCGAPQLIDVGAESDRALLQQDQVGLFGYFFKHVRDQDVLPALTALPAELLRRITQEPAGILLLRTLMDYYRLAATTEDPLQAFRQVAGKLETSQQEQIMTIGEALMEQGMEQGRAQGKAQGMEQGRQAGETARAHAIATNLLNAGAEPAFVQQMTGLSPADMQQLLADT